MVARRAPSNAEALFRPLCFNLYLRVGWRASFQIIPATFGGYGSCDMVYHLVHMTRSILTRRCWVMSTFETSSTFSAFIRNVTEVRPVDCIKMVQLVNYAQGNSVTVIFEHSRQKRAKPEMWKSAAHRSSYVRDDRCIVHHSAVTSSEQQLSNFFHYSNYGFGYSLGGCVSSACFIQFTRSWLDPYSSKGTQPVNCETPVAQRGGNDALLLNCVVSVELNKFLWKSMFCSNSLQ